MATMLDLTGAEREIDAILALARNLGVEEVSEPAVLDASRNQNAGLIPDQVTEVLQFVTLVFGSGTAALVFLKNLREQLATWQGKVAVSDPSSGKFLGTVESTTPDRALEAEIKES